MDKSKINMHKRMAMGMRAGGMGGRTGDMMYSRGYGVGQKSKRMPTMLKDRGPTNMKKGGMKQGYKAREDESLGMRRGKESSKKQSMKARRDESYGKWGKRKSGKINK